MFEVEPQRGPAVELGVAADQVRFEQRHAATDVAADEVRIDDALGHERSTDRRASARMQIRETHGEPHTFELGRGIELAHRFAFDPGAGARQKGAHWFQ